MAKFQPPRFEHPFSVEVDGQIYEAVYWEEGRRVHVSCKTTGTSKFAELNRSDAGALSRILAIELVREYQTRPEL